MNRTMFAMQRRLDMQSRIVIPAEFRSALGWRAGTHLYIGLRPLRKEIVLTAEAEHGTFEECYVRKLDHLGRFSVPASFRHSLSTPIAGELRIECDPAMREVRLTPPPAANAGDGISTCGNDNFKII